MNKKKKNNNNKIKVKKNKLTHKRVKMKNEKYMYELYDIIFLFYFSISLVNDLHILATVL